MPSKIVYLVDDIETSFVHRDIIMFSREYDKIFLFSTEKIDDQTSLPTNVKVVDEFIDWTKFNKVKILLTNFFILIKIYLNECFALKRFLPIKSSFALLCSNIHKANEIQRHLNILGEKNTVDLYYSFWFYDCIYLAWMRLKNKGIKVVTRAHSGDLYEDHISIRGKLLFRNFQLKFLNAVFPISRMGSDYLINVYRTYSEKIKTFFLGTEDLCSINPFNEKQVVIVSCASFRHHKRIHKIAEALLQIEESILWYHFGNENLHTSDPKIPEYLENKSKLQAKPNIKFKPMGFTDNKKLFDFYTETPVNLFISLSAAEGIPVSIMEAISFGIPVLSTDVGGCKEIVNEQTGILIPLDTDTKTIADIITKFKESKMNTIEFRTGVRAYWKAHFDVETNYQQFFKELKNV